jgi:NtrC-family two-component system response regulator AlgB
MKPALKVLVVDDERNIRSTLRLYLASLGCTVNEAASAAAALEALRAQPADLAFVDLRLGAESGLDLVPRLLADRPSLAIVVITAYAAFDTAVEAIKRGAMDYLPKPFTPAQIDHVVERVLAQRSALQRLAQLEGDLADAAPTVELATNSPKMRAALDQLAEAAKHEVPVLMRGENGTGKGVLARALHAWSARRERPFVVVNCPTLTEELLASELFGHTRGAFTGAVRDQPGRVEAAEGGTLFLDEIGELPPSLQAKLLRFLQEKQFERVGETRTRLADVRVVAATNRKIEEEVAAGRFREDLLYRLNVMEVTVPPLRERIEDLASIAEQLLAFGARASRHKPPSIAKDAMAALRAHSWPGNVRELKNVLERALILGRGRDIELHALPERIAAQATRVPVVGGDFTLDEMEREHIMRVLARAPTQDEAARILGIDASTLWRKRKRYDGGS